jgi:hypothetical protein
MVMKLFEEDQSRILYKKIGQFLIDVMIKEFHSNIISTRGNRIKWLISSWKESESPVLIESKFEIRVSIPILSTKWIKSGVSLIFKKDTKLIGDGI